MIPKVQADDITVENADNVHIADVSRHYVGQNQVISRREIGESFLLLAPFAVGIVGVLIVMVAR